MHIDPTAPPDSPDPELSEIPLHEKLDALVSDDAALRQEYEHLYARFRLLIQTLPHDLAEIKRLHLELASVEKRLGLRI